MATKLAQAQLADLPERVGVVETRVEHLNEKVDEIKVDIKEMHDCLDQTRDSLMAELDKMQGEYRINSSKFFEHADKLHAEDKQSHEIMAAKVADLEKIKSKGMIYGMAFLAFLAGSGFAGHLNLGTILKFVGL